MRNLISFLSFVIRARAESKGKCSYYIYADYIFNKPDRVAVR